MLPFPLPLKGEGGGGRHRKMRDGVGSMRESNRG